MNVNRVCVCRGNMGIDGGEQKSSSHTGSSCSHPLLGFILQTLILA